MALEIRVLRIAGGSRAKTAIGLFESQSAVEEVVRALRGRGPAPAASSSSGLDRLGNQADAGTGVAVGNPERLKIGGVPDEDAELYSEGVRRGSVLVAVTSADDRADEAARIMDEHGSSDVEERAAEWMNSGWVRRLIRAAGRGMPPPRGEGTVQAGRHRVEGGGARVFIW